VRTDLGGRVRRRGRPTTVLHAPSIRPLPIGRINNVQPEADPGGEGWVYRARLRFQRTARKTSAEVEARQFDYIVRSSRRRMSFGSLAGSERPPTVELRAANCELPIGGGR
jgi:hypothetical protein